MNMANNRVTRLFRAAAPVPAEAIFGEAGKNKSASTPATLDARKLRQHRS